MKYLAGSIGILPIFPALWWLFAQGMPDVGSAGILAFAATLVIGLFCLFYLWQPDGLLDSMDLKRLGIIALTLGVIVALWYVSDAAIFGIDPFYWKEWLRLARTDRPSGFIMTSIFAVSYAAVLTATFIRVLILKALGMSSRRAGL